MTDALVLSGGSVKGAYQAGVVWGLTESGFAPSIVTGISVGALNAAYLAAFPNDGKGLAEMWRTRITSPDKLVKKRGFIDLAWRVVTKKWAGVVDTEPMANLVRELLGPKLPRGTSTQPQPEVRVGAVNLRTGAIEYASSFWADFLDHVIASTAEPITMPLRQIRGQGAYYDGGLRDIAPLKQAITLGATRVVVVLCQPPGIRSAENLKSGDVLQVASRVVEIVSHEILENDIQRAEDTNSMVRMLKQSNFANRDLAGWGWTARLAGKREIEIRVIRPATGLNVDVASFTVADIERMLIQGHQDGTLAL